MAAMDKSYLVPEYKESYSLWIQPKGDTERRLQREIDLMAGSFPGAPRFPAHVTLLPDIKLPGEEVVAKAHELAAKLNRYYIHFVNVTRGTIYYQCVYLLCAKDEATMEAAAEARRVFGMETPPYMPHLSLLYSDMSMEEREQVVAQSHQRLYGEGSGYDALLVETGFAVDSVAVWYTPTEDKTTASWCKVADIPLHHS